MECGLCGRPVPPQSSSVDGGAACSPECRQAAEALGRPDLEALLGGTEAGGTDEGLPVQPYLGEAIRLRFEVVGYSADVQDIAPWPPVAAPAAPVRPARAPDPGRQSRNPPEGAKPGAEGRALAEPPGRSARPREAAPGPPPAKIESDYAPDLAPVVDGRPGSKRLKLVAGAAAAAGLCWVLLSHTGSSPPTPKPAADPTSSPGPPPWTAGWATTPEGESIDLFAPSLTWSDYRVECRTSRYLGAALVCRAKDPTEFHLIRLSPGRQRNAMRLRRELVAGGKPGEVVDIEVPAPEAPGDEVSIHLEIRQAMFRLSLNGIRAATWEDARLERGGVGVVRESGGAAPRPAVRVVRLGAPDQSGGEDDGDARR